MGLHYHLNIWNTSYGKKKGQESNWMFDSRPLKVTNRPDSLTCRWRVTYCWKVLDKGYNFASNCIAIGGLHKKLCAFKVAGVPVDAISRLPLGSPETKNQLDVAPVERHRVYYKGEGGGFPQVRAVVSLMCPSCPWFVLAPKMPQLCANHLVLVLCRSVSVNKACHFFLVPSQSSSTALYPSIVLWTREHAPTPCPSAVFSFGLTFESRKELGVRHLDSNSQRGSPLGSVWVHSFTFSYTPRSMKCNSRASFLTHTFASPCFGREPKAKVTTLLDPNVLNSSPTKNQNVF
jgi:hypothetical protein